MRENNKVITKVDAFYTLWNDVSHPCCGPLLYINIEYVVEDLYFCFISGLANEDNQHIFMHFPLHHTPRFNSFNQISDIPGVDLTHFNESSLGNLLLCGNPCCTVIHNSIILEYTISYINGTVRLQQLPN